MKSGLSVLVLALALFTPPAFAQGAGASEGLTENLQVVKLSRGGELNVVVSRRTDAKPTIGVLLFPGYPGILRIRSEGDAIRHELNGNFVVRARRFLNSEKVFTVLVDCPTDQWSSCDDRYRSSSQHAADIADVVTAVRALGAEQIYIVGTSYGTVSTSFLAKALEGRIDGAVHTATFTDPRIGRSAHGVPMRSFNWSQTKVPQLFVHHKDDPCEVTRYSSIADRRKDIPLITVEGMSTPKGDPCQAFSAHGFIGRERVVMTAIHDWITARKLETPIGRNE